MGGLAFTYMADEKPRNQSFKLDIFSADDGFYLKKVPFQTISDFQTTKYVAFYPIAMRRCGVQFRELTDHQMFKLEYFIQNYTMSEVV